MVRECALVLWGAVLLPPSSSRFPALSLVGLVGCALGERGVPRRRGSPLTVTITALYDTDEDDDVHHHDSDLCVHVYVCEGVSVKEGVKGCGNQF